MRLAKPRRGDASVTSYERSVLWGSTPVRQPKPYASCLTAWHRPQGACAGIPKSPLFERLSSPIHSVLRQNHHGLRHASLRRNDALLLHISKFLQVFWNNFPYPAGNMYKAVFFLPFMCSSRLFIRYFCTVEIKSGMYHVK